MKSKFLHDGKALQTVLRCPGFLWLPLSYAPDPHFPPPPAPTRSGLLSQFQQDVRQKQMLTPRASDMAVRSRRQTAQVRVLAELSDVKKGSSASACNGRPLDEATLGLTVEKSLGSKLDTFAGYQGSVHYLIETGKLDEGLLRRLFEGAAGVNNERAKRMSNQEKWEQIKLATEQLLSVYTNK